MSGVVERITEVLDASTDRLAESVINLGTAQLNAMLLGGDWAEVDAAEDHQLHLLHGLLGAFSGAADEVEFYVGLPSQSGDTDA